MISMLEGLSINVVVSDPWEFGTLHGTGPFTGKILKVGVDPSNSERQSALIQLDMPLVFEGVQCEFFVANSRHVDESLQDILNGSSVVCNLTRISQDHASSSNPLDLSWWRGGVGLICTLSKE